MISNLPTIFEKQLLEGTMVTCYMAVRNELPGTLLEYNSLSLQPRCGLECFSSVC